MTRFSSASILLLTACLLAGCNNGGDPENLGTYYSCADWVRSHRPNGNVAQREAQDDWLVGEALDAGFTVTDAPVADGRTVTKDVLVSRVSGQCANDQVLQTLQGAIEKALTALGGDRPQ